MDSPRSSFLLAVSLAGAPTLARADEPAAAVTSPRSARASVALDYATAVAACPSGDRLSDEVSAKLGFVPWDPQASTRMRVRIAEDGAELVGTIELPDGNAKVMRDSTCPRLVASLATAVAVALDDTIERSAAAPAPQPAVAVAAAPAATARATVHVRTTRPGVVVSAVTQRAFVQSGDYSAAGVGFKTVCRAPCSFELDPGVTWSR